MRVEGADIMCIAGAIAVEVGQGRVGAGSTAASVDGAGILVVAVDRVSHAGAIHDAEEVADGTGIAIVAGVAISLGMERTDIREVAGAITVRVGERYRHTAAASTKAERAEASVVTGRGETGTLAIEGDVVANGAGDAIIARIPNVAGQERAGVHSVTDAVAIRIDRRRMDAPRPIASIHRAWVGVIAIHGHPSANTVSEDDIPRGAGIAVVACAAIAARKERAAVRAKAIAIRIGDGRVEAITLHIAEIEGAGVAVITWRAVLHRIAETIAIGVRYRYVRAATGWQASIHGAWVAVITNGRCAGADAIRIDLIRDRTGAPVIAHGPDHTSAHGTIIDRVADPVAIRVRSGRKNATGRGVARVQGAGVIILAGHRLPETLAIRGDMIEPGAGIAVIAGITGASGQ